MVNKLISVLKSQPSKILEVAESFSNDRSSMKKGSHQWNHL